MEKSTIPEIITKLEPFIITLIGLMAATLGWFVNELILKKWENFKKENRQVVQKRLENVYQPLYYLTGILLLPNLKIKDKLKTKSKIENILMHYGHLLTPSNYNLIIAFLFLENADTKKLKEEREALLRETDKMKILIYGSYKTYEDLFTNHLLGRVKIIWSQIQFKFFSFFLTVLIIFLICYLAYNNYTISIWIIISYLVIGTIYYVIKDIWKSKKLRKNKIK